MRCSWWAGHDDFDVVLQLLRCVFSLFAQVYAP